MSWIGWKDIFGTRPPPEAADPARIDDLRAVMKSRVGNVDQAVLALRDGVSKGRWKLAQLGMLVSPQGDFGLGQSMLYWISSAPGFPTPLSLSENVDVVDAAGSTKWRGTVRDLKFDEIKDLVPHLWIREWSRVRAKSSWLLGQKLCSQLQTLHQKRAGDRATLRRIQESKQPFYELAVGQVDPFGAEGCFLTLFREDDPEGAPISDEMVMEVSNASGGVVVLKKFAEFSEDEILRYFEGHLWRMVPG